MTFGADDKGQTRSEYWLSKIYPFVTTSGGAAFYGIITTANTTTNFKVASLVGMGTDLLNDAYYCQIIQADAAAPEGEIQKVSAYDTSDGDITVGAAFTIAPEIGDYVLILHESVVSAIANSTDNLFMKDVVGDKTDTSAIPSATTSIVAMVKKVYDTAIGVATSLLTLTETGGTITTDGTEQNVYINNAPAGIFAPRIVQIDFTNQTAGETVVVREYYRIISGGNLIMLDEVTFAGVQDPLLKNVTLEDNRYGVQVTIEKTVGANRDYDYEAVYKV